MQSHVRFVSILALVNPSKSKTWTTRLILSHVIYDEPSLLAVLSRADADSFHRGGNHRPEMVVGVMILVLIAAIGGVDARAPPIRRRSLKRTPEAQWRNSRRRRRGTGGVLA